MLKSRLGSQSSVISINSRSNFFTGNVILNTSFAANSVQAGPQVIPYINGNIIYMALNATTSSPTFMNTDANLTNFTSGKLYSYSYSGNSGNLGLYGTATFDSTGNVWTLLGVGTTAAGVAKLDANMNVLSHTQYYCSTSPAYFVSSPPTASQINIDSNNNVYLTGQNTIATNINRLFYLLKLDSAGSVQYWYNIDTGNPGSNDPDLIRDAILSGNYLYILVTPNDTPQPGLLMKFDLSGNLIYSKKLSATGTDKVGFFSLYVYNDEVYVCGIQQISNVNQAIVVKYDVNGNVSWQKVFSTSGTPLNGYNYILVYLNEIYLIGSTLISNKFYIIVTKLDTSGNILFSRQLNATTQTFGITASLQNPRNGLKIINDKINFTVRTQTGGKSFLFVLPTDGSIPGSGTYTCGGETFTYTNITVTSSDISLTSASRSVTITSPSYTVTNIISRLTGTVTVPSSTYTFNKTYI